MFKKTTLLAMLASASFAINANAAEYDITGTIIGPEGKPVKDAFIYVKEDPIVCAMTTHDGKFVLASSRSELDDGAKTLVASWSGCKIKNIAIPTTEQKNLKINVEYEDTDFIKIETGAAYFTINKYEGMANRGLDPASPEMKECVKAYKDFFAKKGASIREKVLNNEPLTKEEARYRYISIAGLWTTKDKSVYKKNKKIKALIKIANIAMDKANSGALLDEKDIMNLRYYYALGGAERTGGNSMYKLKPHEINTPSIINDFFMVNINDVFKSKNYSRYASLSLTEYLRHEGLALLLCNAGYRQKKGRKYNYLSLTESEKLRQYYPFKRTKLSDLLGEKPIYFRTFTQEDAAINDYTIVMCHLSHAYKDDINFADLNFRSPTCGDMYLWEHSRYGRNPNENILKGRACRLGEYDYLPERLARYTRIGYMNRPYQPEVPTFVEYWGTPGRRFNLVPLDKMGLLDKNGKVSGKAYKGTRPTYGNYYLFSNNHDAGTVMSLIKVEKDIRALLANDGVFDKEKNMTWKSIDYPNKQLIGHFSHGGGLLDITNIDKENKIITAKPRNAKKYGTDEYTFQYNDNTRYSLCSENPHKEKNITYSTGTIDSFKVGDDIYLDIEWLKHKEDIPLVKGNWNQRTYFEKFTLDELKGKTHKLHRLMNYKIDLKFRNMMMYQGTINNIKGDIVTVTRNKPTLAEYPGLRYFDEDKNVIIKGLYDPRKKGEEDFGEKMRDIMLGWMNSKEDKITYRFKVDDAVRIARNGEEDQDKSTLKVGDKVTVCYEMFWESQKLSKEIITPELIVASEPWER